MFGQNSKRIKKFKNDCSSKAVPCFVSKSVVEESEDKINSTTSFIGNEIPTKFNDYLMNKGLNSAIAISKININELEDFFFIHTGSRPAKKYVYDIVKDIELFIIITLEQSRVNEPNLSLAKFMVRIIGELLKYSRDVAIKYNELIKIKEAFAKKDDCAIDDPTYQRLLIDKLQDLDARHIATAFAHQQKTGDTCIFVTQDRNSLLEKKQVIYRESKIICCDPLYAIHN